MNFALFVPLPCAQGLGENFVYVIRGLKTSPSSPSSILVPYSSPSLPLRVEGYIHKYTCSGLTIAEPKHLCASWQWTTILKWYFSPNRRYLPQVHKTSLAQCKTDAGVKRAWWFSELGVWLANSSRLQPFMSSSVPLDRKWITRLNFGYEWEHFLLTTCSIPSFFLAPDPPLSLFLLPTSAQSFHHSSTYSILKVLNYICS